MNRSSHSSSSSANDLICKIKYQNNLPDIPFDPKFIAYPFDPNRFTQYKTTTLEKSFKWDILTEQDLGVNIDLIKHDFSKVEQNVPMHINDEKLLEEDTTNAADLKRAEQHNKTVSWLRRNEYISTENTRFQPKQYDAPESKVGYTIKKKMNEVDFYKDLESQKIAIENSFEASKIPVERHYSKTNVYPVQEFQIFPDFESWRHPCAQVQFDDDPAPKNHSFNTQNEEMSQAIIKGLVDKNGEQFVAYFLPTDESLSKRKRDEENGVDYEENDNYEYKLTREYTWNIKSKSSTGYEENYYFIFRNDAVYYNELETRVRLSKRRSKLGKVSNTKLSVNYRDFTRQETRMQNLRNRDIGIINEEDDDESEEEAEEEEENEDNAEEEVEEEEQEDDVENVEEESEQNEENEDVDADDNERQEENEEEENEASENSSEGDQEEDGGNHQSTSTDGDENDDEDDDKDND